MDDRQKQLLQIIYNFWKMSPSERYPEITLNHTCGICGDDALELILECEKALGAPYGALEKNFPFGIYFDPEIQPIWNQILGTLFLPLYLLAFFVNLCKKCIYKILNKKIEKPYNDNSNGKPPLTALHFVNIMIEIWEQYQKENKQ